MTYLSLLSGRPEGLPPAHHQHTCGGSRVVFDPELFSLVWQVTRFSIPVCTVPFLPSSVHSGGILADLSCQGVMRSA